ncbi:ASCH domain-containing protein [Chloroflexota bacterium]
MNVLLSIKPKYAEAILEGRKLFEFRKSIFKHHSVERVYLYATMPVGKVVGSFKVGEIIRREPKLLWKELGRLSGISKSEFFKYFEDSDIGFAIEIRDLEVWQIPVNPRPFLADFKPPRSYKYIDGQFSHMGVN